MQYDPELGGLIYQAASAARRVGGISFAGGYPDPALFDVDGLAEAFAAMFRDSARVALQYGERDGQPALRELIAAFESADGARVDAGEVIVTNGGQQGIELSVRTLTRPGDTILLDSPVFPTALQVFHLAGLDGRSVRTDADGIDPEALESMARRHRPRLLYLVPSYSNPGGTLLSVERRREVLRLAVRYDFHVIADDPYSRLWFESPPPASMLAVAAGIDGARERLTQVSSLSKLVAPGLRLGWMIPPAGSRRELLFAKQASDIHSALHTQHAVTAYWKAGHLERHLPAIRLAYRERARALVAALDDVLGERVEFVRPGGGMFVWCRLPEVPDTRALFDTASAARVFFVPGVAFYPRDPDCSTMRLSFATTPAEQMRDGVERLRLALDGLAKKN
ncbi:MAG: PLP-dependent aminotransferase family protein [Burkholderiaceae bacterium]